MFMLDDLQVVKKLIQETKTIAVVGLSPKVARPSNMVARYLLEVGFTIIPVNPGQDEILGLRCYANLKEIGQKIDMVDIFRRSEDVLPIVEDAIEVGAQAIWMQQGIRNQQAAELAKKAGLHVVMDRCLKVDHQQLV